MRSLGLGFCPVAAVLIGLLMVSCGDDPEGCVSRFATYCDKGAVHWVNSCGFLEGVEQYCRCGCKPDHSECRSCSCDCSEVGPCCNGCLSLAEGQSCDDGDPETLGDVCSAGVCSGWNPADLAEPAVPAEPESPAGPATMAEVLLVSWTCPAGWEAVVHDSLLDQAGEAFSWCRPPPLPRLKLNGYTTPLKPGEQAGDRPVCEPETQGGFPVLGQTECQPLGAECQAEWPIVPGDVSGGRIYVLAGSAGTGTQLDPFGTIAEGVAAANPGDVVVIAGGTYPETLDISKDLTLWGNCVMETVIDAPGPYESDAAALKITGQSQVEVRNLRITGELKGVLVESAGGSASLEGVWIHDCTGAGVDAGPGQVRMQGCLVDSTRAGGADFGIGLGTSSGAQVELTGSLFENNRDVNISITDRETVGTLTDVASRECIYRVATREYGYGLEVFRGAQVTVTRGLIDRNRHYAVVVAHPDSRLTLQDVAVLDTRPKEADQTMGIGISSESTAVLTLRQVLVEGNHTTGVATILDGAYLVAQDIVIRETRPQAVNSAFGRGLSIYWTAQAQVSRALVENNHDLGVLVMDGGTSAALQDLVILGTRSDQSNGRSGAGFLAGYGAQATVQRGLVARSRSAGIAIGSNALVTLDDITVGETLSEEISGNMGQGLDVSQQGNLTVHRGLIEGNRTSGVLVNQAGSLAVLEDVTVRDTLSRETDGYVGNGLHVANGGRLEVKRVLLEANRAAGLFVKDPDSTASGEDLIIQGTLSHEINSEDGYGIWLIDGARLNLVRGLLDGNRNSGLLLMDAGTVAVVEDLTVRDTLEQASDLEWGRGVEVSHGARLELTRGLFERNRDFGIFVGKPGSVAVLEDVTVLDTLSRASDGYYGIGLEVVEGGEADLTRGWFERNRLIGVVLTGENSRAVMEDLTVIATLSPDGEQYAGLYGAGGLVHDGAHLMLTRALFEENQMVGLLAADNAPSMVAEDLIVRNTQSQPADGYFGWGLGAQLGAQVTVTRGLLEGNHEVGALAIGEDARLDLDQVLVRDTYSAACYEQPDAECPDASLGTGLGAIHSGGLSASRVVVETSQVIGVQLALGGTFDAQALTIADNPIGFNVQDTPEDYQFFEVVSGLRMENNLINFDSTELPVPNPMSVLE